MSSARASGAKVIGSDVSVRMDRMPRSRWHWMIIFALGITWVLDGLGLQLVSNADPVLQEPSTLNFTSGQVGATASIYLVGEVVGALFFGYMTDRLGRKRLFMVTSSRFFRRGAQSQGRRTLAEDGLPPRMSEAEQQDVAGLVRRGVVRDRGDSPVVGASSGIGRATPRRARQQGQPLSITLAPPIT